MLTLTFAAISACRTFNWEIHNTDLTPVMRQIECSLYADVLPMLRITQGCIDIARLSIHLFVAINALRYRYFVMPTKRQRGFKPPSLQTLFCTWLTLPLFISVPYTKCIHYILPLFMSNFHHQERIS